MQGALAAAPGVESVTFDAARDEYLVRYTASTPDGPRRLTRAVDGVVVMRPGRRALEEARHRLGGRTGSA